MKTMKKVGQFLLVFAIASIGIALSACGQKGPLVLPEDKPANDTTEQSKQLN